jgi:chitinase
MGRMIVRMIKHTAFLLVLGFLLMSIRGRPIQDKPKFRIVGYYSLRGAMSADVKTIPFGELTHINLYFLNPDELGDFKMNLDSLVPFIRAAHAKQVKVIPSIGGGGQHAYYHKLLNDSNRAKLVEDLLQIVMKYDFDGIDVDLEGSDIDENYENLAVDLARVFKPKKKLVTSAIAVFYKDALSDRALAQYDFVNLMSYDHTGPWMPSKPGPHSTYEQAVEDLDYFRTVRKIPKDRIVLGVGFYGYGFGPTPDSPASSMNFGDIVNRFPGAENVDQLDLPGGAILYYNGIPTIKRKTILAKAQASGIMIWQISGDATGDKSLLRAIYDTAYTE